MRRGQLTICVASLASAVVVLIPGSAAAGIYAVAQCNASFGVGAPDAQSFDQTAAGRYTEADFCASEASGGGLLVFHPADGGAVPGGVSAGWYFLPPTGTRFSGIEVLASGSRGAGNDYIPELIGFAPIAAPNTSALNFGAPLGAEARYRWDPSQIGDGSGFTLQMRCPRSSAAGAPPCEAGDGNFLNVRQIDLTVNDPVAPTLAAAGANLSPAASVRGVIAADVAARDVGAGIRDITASINGSGGGQLQGTCATNAGRAIRLAPCAAELAGQIALDTTKAPWRQGINQIRFCATEFADSGAAQACAAGPDLRVDNACPLDDAAGVAEIVNLRFKGGRAGDGRTIYGSNVRLAGGARDASGAPVSGAQICVGQTTDGDRYGPEELVGTTPTGRRGRFSIELPSGPSRAFRVAHWPPAGPPTEEYASLEVKAKPRLVIRPRGRITEGEPFRLNAKLNRPVVPGQTAAIQARAGAGYVTIPQCAGPVDADGRLSCTERLKKQPGQASYVLRYRVVAPHAEGSAYLSGMSKVLRKEVGG